MAHRRSEGRDSASAQSRHEEQKQLEDASNGERDRQPNEQYRDGYEQHDASGPGE